MNDTAPDSPKASAGDGRARNRVLFGLIVLLVAIATAGVTWLLMSIQERKWDARNPYIKIVDVDETSTDPAVWGMNWPRQYDQYRRTVDTTRTRFGGSEAMPEDKLERDPWLRRMFSGYAFSIDYRDRRGHAYMLADQEQTRRVTEKPQPGACLHCHASIIPTYRRVGIVALGQSPSTDPFDFNWPAVMKGFEVVGAMSYADAHAELLKTPDGTPDKSTAMPPPGARGAGTAPTTREVLAAHAGDAHPVSCIDCHDPKIMELRVTRPGFVRGIQALAASDAPVPHLASIDRWRAGKRDKPYDPNVDASRQEMRSFTCAQCHVEYYCGPKTALFFPWDNGLRVEQIEKTYDNYKFPDGHRFFDWKHGETGAEVLKAQHPEFEMWSQGMHARSGVACADCHMPYMRQGALKISDHHVRSPLLNVARARQTCHHYPEQELLDRVQSIQDRTSGLMQRAGTSITDMFDAVRTARAAGATDEQLQNVLALHRKAQWRLDFVAAENSMGFHAPQESARVLGEAIDYARQGQIEAQRVHLTPATRPTQPAAPPPVGVTPTGNAPADPAPKP